MSTGRRIRERYWQESGMAVLTLSWLLACSVPPATQNSASRLQQGQAQSAALPAPAPEPVVNDVPVLPLTTATLQQHKELRSLSDLPAARLALLQQRQQLEQQISAQLAKPQTCASNADCEALALGSRPCGGPDRYLAYSREQPELEQLAMQHRRVSALLNQQERRLGVCSVLVKPASACLQARCELAAASQAE